MSRPPSFSALGLLPTADPDADRGTAARVRFHPPLADRGGAGALRVEFLEPADANCHREAWIDLQGRSLEPNVFLDPDFALSAARHLGYVRRPKFIFVWDRGDAGRLLAVCALTRPVGPFRSFVRFWDHDLMALGSPILDEERGEEALVAMLDWVGRSGTGTAGILFTAVPAEGPIAALVDAAARRTRRSAITVATWDRAILRHGAAAARSGHAALSGKGAKEARRQRRRLEERGELRFTSARSDWDVRDAAERFLVLEARGWKGDAGTALLMDPSRTAFMRAVTRLLVRRGRCRIDSLTLDGRPIAMGIVLTDGGTDFLWKIAYDESLARFSPGVQFVLGLTESQGREGRAVATDSCAVPGHPMIDRLWRDRLAMSDIAVATGPGFHWAVNRRVAYGRVRSCAKRVLAAVKDRTRGFMRPVEAAAS